MNNGAAAQAYLAFRIGRRRTEDKGGNKESCLLMLVR
jgi:hypothetical protein